MRYLLLVLLLSCSLQALHAGGNSAGGNSAGGNIISAETAGRLDINTASAHRLAEVLPGIGPAKAALIVQWRERNGAFQSVDQLQEVKGIGPKTVDKLRALVRVGVEPAAHGMQNQQGREEQKVRADVSRVLTAAVEAARPEAVRALPGRAWYRKSMLELLRTH